MAHRESHDADAKRRQVSASVNIRSAEKLGLVDDEGGESAAPLRVDLPQDLRTRIAAILVDALASDAADQLLAIRYGGDTQAQLTIDCGTLADAVIRELGLEVEDGECGYCHAMLPGCRYVTEWISEVTDDG